MYADINVRYLLAKHAESAETLVPHTHCVLEAVVAGLPCQVISHYASC